MKLCIHFPRLFRFYTARELFVGSLQVLLQDCSAIRPCVGYSGFVAGVSCLFNMPPPRSTNNSLAAGVVSSASSNTVTVPASSTPSSSSLLSADSITEAVVRALGSSLPTILSSIQVNAPSSQASSNPATSSVISSSVFFGPVHKDFCRFANSCKLSGFGGQCLFLARYVCFAAFYFYFYSSVGHHQLELSPPAGSNFLHVFLGHVC